MTKKGKYKARLINRLNDLCNEFLNCIRDGYVSKKDEVEHSNDVERLMKFLDADLSTIGIDGEFMAMTHKQLQDSLRRYDDKDRNKAIKFLINDILGESVSIKYIDEFNEIYNDSQFDRDKITDRADTLRFLTLLMLQEIWSKAILKDIK